MEAIERQELFFDGRYYKTIPGETKKGDLVYYKADEPSQLSGIYLRGDWDDMNGYKLYRPLNHTQQVYGTDATATNIFTIVPEDTSEDLQQTKNNELESLARDLANQWRGIVDGNFNSEDLPCLEDIIQWGLEARLPKLQKNNSIEFLEWVNRSGYVMVSGTYHAYEGGKYTQISYEDLYDKFINRSK